MQAFGSDFFNAKVNAFNVSSLLTASIGSYSCFDDTTNGLFRSEADKNKLKIEKI